MQTDKGSTEKKNSFFVGQWLYTIHSLRPDENGDTVLMTQASFGPAEYYEWGFDKDNAPYEKYEWCGNDLYKCTNYRKSITEKELTEKIEKAITLFGDNGLTQAVSECEAVLEWSKHRTK